jgi:hypothetical protein
VKPIDLHALAKAAAANKLSAALEPGSELQQSLWQLLLPLPRTAAVDTGAGLGLERSPNAARDERERDITSALSSAAYILANAVQQLSWTRYADGSRDAALQERSGEQAFQVRLDVIDDQSGTAAIEVWNPELGDIALEVEWTNGAVRVIATAPDERSAEVLLRGRALLAERLFRQGVALEALDVIVRKSPARAAPRPRARARKQEK